MDVFGSRLRQARNAAGLSLRALADRVGVSQTAILKYEQGRISPASDLLMRLAKAVGLPVDHLFRPYEIALARVQFRRLAPFGEKLFRAIEAQVIDQLERRLELEALLPAEPPRFVRIEGAAADLRRHWGLGIQPIAHLIDLCEQRGVRVIAVDESGFDGLYGEAGDMPIVVISRGWPGDRQRFTLAHELGHLMGIEEEAECNRFAGAFLFPDEAVLQWFGASRRSIEWQELLLAKQEFGISMGATVHRLRELEIISEHTYRETNGEFRRRGWKEREPGPQLPAERAGLFEQRLFAALGEDLVSESKAAELLGCSIDALRARRAIDG